MSELSIEQVFEEMVAEFDAFATEATEFINRQKRSYEHYYQWNAPE